jgi:hypothetical protein
LFFFLLSSYIINGPLFIRPCDITNRDQLIITTKSSYEREVFKCDDSNKEISVENLKGKCSVLSFKHYSTCKLLYFFFLMKILILFLGRLTEIPEHDVYVCESKYIPDDHSLRSLTKGLKVENIKESIKTILSFFFLSRERHYH